MAAAHFCSQCGTKLLADASFCVECGARASGAKRIALPVGRYAPAVVVLVVLLITGGAVSIGLWRPQTPPSVPGRQAGGTTTTSAAPAAGAAMPEGHPPISIPDDVKQTLRDMAKSAEASPDDVALWKRLAEAQYRAGQIEPTFLAEAERSLQHVLEREPQNAEALRSLGNIAFDQEQPEKAITHYTKYLELKPDDDNVLTDLNTMRLAAGKTDEAIAGYKQILAKNPSFFQAQFNLGLAYFRAGQQTESLAALEKARGLATDDRARQQVDQILARMKGGGAAGGAPVVNAAPGNAPAPGGDTLRAGIEEYFRSHQIMGSKLDRFEWENDHSVKVMLHDFPMSAMPEFVRNQLSDRIRARIKEQKAAHNVNEPVAVKMVDSGSGETMETVTE